MEHGAVQCTEYGNESQTEYLFNWFGEEANNGKE